MIVCADALTYLRGNRWLVQNGYIPKAHAILCDPPYALPGGFMSKDWDNFNTPQAYQAWVTEWAGLLIDYVYPGALGLFFGGTRTYHRLATGLEDAGWEITDCMMWVQGQGFPKSAAIDKLLDKEAGAAREVVGVGTSGKNRNVLNAALHPETFGGPFALTAPATPLAARWEGYGTAMKPAYEPVVVARAPRGKHTYAALARTFGTGALNIDGTRIGVQSKWDGQRNPDTTPASTAERSTKPTAPGQLASSVIGNVALTSSEKAKAHLEATSKTDTECFNGRSPAEPSASQSECSDLNTTKYGKTPTDLFLPDASSTISTGTSLTTDWRISNSWNAGITPGYTTGISQSIPMGPLNQITSEPTATSPEYVNAEPHGSESTGASARWPSNFGLICTCDGDDHAADCPVRQFPNDEARFFYVSKAAAWEREAGLSGFALRENPTAAYSAMKVVKQTRNDGGENVVLPRRNHHPTVKPIRLAEYLARLILPPEGDGPRRLLVPFAGSGSEMIGARLAGWDAVTGIEREAEYVALAEARLAWWAQFASYDDARAAYEKERKAKPALVVIEDKPEQIARTGR